MEDAKAKVGAIRVSNATRGGALGRAPILVMALLAVLGILFLWVSTSRLAGDPPRGQALDPISLPEVGEVTGPAVDPLATARTKGAPESRFATDGGDPTLSGLTRDVVQPGDKRFEGRGELRGHVEVSGSEPFPDAWRLVIRPSTTLIGKELAEERMVEFGAGTQDFVIEDLPLAGYDVIAESESLNGRVQPVLLDRRNPSPFLNLRLVPAGFLEGDVKDSDGVPAAGVVLTLVQLGGDGESIQTATNVGGKFRFDRVLDGSYQLVVGQVAAPIVRERTSLRFSAPSMTLPTIELPPLATIEVRVTDVELRGLPDVTVRGSGSRGGVFEGMTNAFGDLRLEHLPAGRYRINLECEGFDSYRLSIDVVAGEVFPLPLKMWSKP